MVLLVSVIRPVIRHPLLLLYNVGAPVLYASTLRVVAISLLVLFFKASIFCSCQPWELDGSDVIV